MTDVDGVVPAPGRPGPDGRLVERSDRPVGDPDPAAVAAAVADLRGTVAAYGGLDLGGYEPGPFDPTWPEGTGDAGRKGAR